MAVRKNLLGMAVSLICWQTVAQNNVSVDPLTGRAQVSIPIGQISDGGVGVPISVNYSGGGVRVEQGEGSAGMSWNLAAGGAVSRELRGLPDDIAESGGRRGWYHDALAANVSSFSPSLDLTLSVCSDEKEEFDFLKSLAFKKDSEPDIFHFYAPGLNGSFVFGTDGQPKLLQYADLKIDITWPAGQLITEFKITNNQGVAYTFARKEELTRVANLPPSASTVEYYQHDYHLFKTPITYTGTWYLTKIESPAGGLVTLSYEDGDEVSSSDKIVMIKDTTEVIQYYLATQFKPQRLTSIYTATRQATLTWEQTRISSILITSSFTTREKQFDFHYVNVSDLAATAFSPSKAFLRTITQVEQCTSFPAYEFTYDNVNFTNSTTGLPISSNKGQDYWGFYNGTATNKKPDIYVYNNLTGAEKYRIQQIPGSSPSSTISGGGRAVNATYADYGSLTSIKYPSGYTTTIEYESNSFFDAVANATLLGGGVRVKKLTASGGEKGSDNIVTEYEYKLANNESSGVLIYRPVFAFNDGDEIVRSTDNMAPDGGLLYSRTTVKQTGKGKTVYEFAVPATYPSTSYGGDWVAATTYMARRDQYPCVAAGSIDVGNYVFPFAPSTSYDFERGLPKSVTDFAENGTMVQKRSFKHERHYLNATEVNPVRYDMLGDSIYLFSKYKIMTGVSKVTTADTVRLADEIAPSNLLETITKYKYYRPGMMDSVTVTNSDGVTSSIRYRYAHHFLGITNPDSGSPESVAIKTLNDNFRHGALVETIQSRNDGSSYMVTGASLSLYKDYGGKTLPYKSLVFPATTGFTKATVSGSSTHTLSYHSAYIPTSTVLSYNSKGGVRSVKDNKRNRSGILYVPDDNSPLVAVGNAVAEECFYDGFDGPGFEVIAGTSLMVTGWSGLNARSLTTSTILRKDGITLGTGKYRFACYAKATGSVQVVYRAMENTTIKSSSSASYTGAGQWQYLEGTLDMTGVPATFSLEVTVTGGSVEIDEVRFLPHEAMMTVTTADPMVGVTTASDDRGFSGFTGYDGLGRLHYQMDRNKNIVEVHEYRYANTPIAPLSSNFTENRSDPVMAGEQVQFTAPSNCTGATYSWKANGVQVSTSASFIHAFTKFGHNEMALTVTSSEGVTTTVKDFCIEPAANGAITISSTTNTNVSQCGPYPRTIVVDLPIPNFGCDGLDPVNYVWYYQVQGGSYTEFAQTTTNSVTFDISTKVDPEQYTWFNVKCVLESSCILFQEAGKQSCAGTFPLTDEKVLTFTLYDEACQ